MHPMVFGYLPKYATSINNTIKISDLLIYNKMQLDVIPTISINTPKIAKQLRPNFNFEYHIHNNYHCYYGRRCPFGGSCKK